MHLFMYVCMCVCDTYIDRYCTYIHRKFYSSYNNTRRPGNAAVLSGVARAVLAFVSPRAATDAVLACPRALLPASG